MGFCNFLFWIKYESVFSMLLWCDVMSALFKFKFTCNKMYVFTLPSNQGVCNKLLVNSDHCRNNNKIPINSVNV